MRVIQVLPDLDSGGVERGTVEFARYLVLHGHDSIVISAGGRLVEQLIQEGSQHIVFPVRNKSIFGLRHFRRLRELVTTLKADVIHVRSRWPAWMIRLAVRGIPKIEQPAIVSTFHGLYSVNFYSAVMSHADKVIAISDCVCRYITDNYPRLPHSKITVVHRGVDLEAFTQLDSSDSAWEMKFFKDFPQLQGKSLVLMPGRLSRWKGQEQFIEIIGLLRKKGLPCHGLIVGSAAPGKESFEQELKSIVHANKLNADISFLGHRNDVRNLYVKSSVVCNLSQKPEPFGRTVIESLALGTPVVAFAEGGPAESLAACLPSGLIEPGNLLEFAAKVEEFLKVRPQINFSEEFTLEKQASKTVGVYQAAIDDKNSEGE